MLGPKERDLWAVTALTFRISDFTSNLAFLSVLGLYLLSPEILCTARKVCRLWCSFVSNQRNSYLRIVLILLDPAKYQIIALSKGKLMSFFAVWMSEEAWCWPPLWTRQLNCFASCWFILHIFTQCFVKITLWTSQPKKMSYYKWPSCMLAEAFPNKSYSIGTVLNVFRDRFQAF